MDISKNMLNNPLTQNLKTELRYNRPLSINNKILINTSKNNPHDPSLKFERALVNLKEGLAELPNDYLPNESPNFSYNNLPLKKISIQKNKYLRARTPKRNYNFPKKNLNFLDNSKITHLNTTDDFITQNNRKTLTNRINQSLYPITKDNISEYNNDIINLERVYNININDFSKPKEIVMLNTILKKQNNEFRIKTSEMRNKINELLNNLKAARMDNQRLNNEKKNLLTKISFLENELNIKQNISLNELESKNNMIEQLKNEITKFNIIINNKDSQIINLKNNLNNINNINNNISNYNNTNQYYKNIQGNDINELEDNIDEENNNMNNNMNINNGNININNLLNQINILQNQLKDYDNIKKYLNEVEGQKNSYEFQQIENEKIINGLNQQINLLRHENNVLKKKNITTPQNSELNSQIKQLYEENNNLKNKIKKLENDNKNKNKNDDIDINYLKNDLEEKNNEINDLKEKMKDLMGQLNISKNKNKDLTKNIETLKQEIEQLNIKISNLEAENLNNQQQIFELSNLNNKLQIRVNSVHSGNFKLNTFGRKDNNQELEQQIQLLQQKNEELQEQLMYANQGNNNSINISKIIQEKQELEKENLDLKNELLILKNQINENDNENETSYNISDNNNAFESNKIKEMEKRLEEMQKKYDLNVAQLKKKENENQNLLSIIKNKENEAAMLQNQLSNNTNSNNISNDYKHMNSSNILKNAELTDENEKLKKEILEKNKKIEQLETDINNIKRINNQLIKEINELKGNYQNQNIDNDIRQSAPEERISITIDNLKEELKDKNLQIEKLIQENNNLKNNIKKNNNKNLIINDDDDEKEIKNEINPFRTTTTLNNLGLSDAEKIKIYKEQIKELKLLNDSDSIQIRTLKVDIKEMKEKIQKMETFSGQLKNFDEFISLLNKALLDYRPKKKEQKEALNKLIEVMNNHRI